jgi:hypothetical protein
MVALKIINPPLAGMVVETPQIPNRKKVSLLGLSTHP